MRPELDPQYRRQWEAVVASEKIWEAYTAAQKIDTGMKRCTPQLALSENPRLKRSELSLCTSVNKNYEFYKGPKDTAYGAAWESMPFARWEHHCEYSVWPCWENQCDCDSFENWLEETVFTGAVDINHEAFFDGTASNDGEGQMMTENYYFPTLRDSLDECTRLHWHKYAAGLMYNYIQEKVPKEQRRF
ncbi:hypothetical protein N7448_007533 [Penicillium atrosanguineum]|uniref:Uncharacterized protein n=2 Tax=Penicillium atrosanguineum TaxID=1132637 RepID=A0A9W9UCP5_9EURO|nr:hypothetical protein N7448_007533 [Penicillium atrosanguineum]KAJ5146958.1 hypothetical protein N7526_000310 [Penicillium atrosanguineum]KAJ5331731.1 hypothetical protein N7476_001514 [Penicillium atrosanguineum]